ncbi:Dynein heavy chain family protein, partial [Reticulomyxa filosa]
IEQLQTRFEIVFDTKKSKKGTLKISTELSELEESKTEPADGGTAPLSGSKSSRHLSANSNAGSSSDKDKNKNRIRKPRSQSFDNREKLEGKSEYSQKQVTSKTPKGTNKTIASAFEEEKLDLKSNEKKKEEKTGLIELNLNDETKIEELKTIFGEFEKALESQKQILIDNFSKALKTKPATENKMLLIDKDGTIARIRKIGLITGKKFEELETEQNLAIEKLKQILQFETDVNLQHKKALELQMQVDKEIQIIQEKQAIVDAELAKVQPAIDEARKAVGSTTKADWNELRTYKNPKDVLKAVMTVAVALVKNDPKILTGSNSKDKKSSQTKTDDNWSEVKREVNYDLVKQLMSFLDNNQAETLDENVVAMIKEYLQTATYEQAVNASKVAGPVFLWIKSVIFYSELVVKIKPLKLQIQELQLRLTDRKQEMALLKVQEKDLADKIRTCRGEMLEMVGYKKVGSLYFL